MNNSFKIKGNIIDVFNHKIFYGEITIKDKKIDSITNIADNENEGENYILPGFIDSHVHIESSMLVPAEFAKLA